MVKPTLGGSLFVPLAVLLVFTGGAIGSHLGVTHLPDTQVGVADADLNPSNVTVNSNELRYFQGNVSEVRLAVENHGTSDITIQIHVALKLDGATQASVTVTRQLPAGREKKYTIALNTSVAPEDFNRVETVVSNQ